MAELPLVVASEPRLWRPSWNAQTRFFAIFILSLVSVPMDVCVQQGSL